MESRRPLKKAKNGVHLNLGGHHRLKRRCQEGVLPGRLQTAFIPVKTSPPVPMHQALPATIRIEVPHPKGVVVVSWPAENAATCSAFLRDLLR
jgi:hypothetical protein